MPRARVTPTRSNVRSASGPRCIRTPTHSNQEEVGTSPSRPSLARELHVQVDSVRSDHVVEVDEVADVLLEGLFGNRQNRQGQGVDHGDVASAAQFLIDHLVAVASGDVDT